MPAANRAFAVAQEVLADVAGRRRGAAEVDKVCRHRAPMAVADVRDGASLAVGGFGLAGIPWVLIEALLEQGADGLTVVSNNCGVDGAGLGLLLEAHRIDRVIASYVGENREFARQFLAGEVQVELTPQGTLAERLRAGGSGIGGVLHPDRRRHAGRRRRAALAVRTPDGTVAVASPAKEVRSISGREQVLEEAITTDFALVRAARGRPSRQRGLPRVGPQLQPAGRDGRRLTIVEAEQVVRVG